MPEKFGRMGIVEAGIQVLKGVGCQVSGVREEKEKNNQFSSEEEIPHAHSRCKINDPGLKSVGTGMFHFTTGGIIHVKTENVASFSLDLREGRFLKFKNWEIVINDEIKTNAPAGRMFAFGFADKISNIEHGISNYEVKKEPPRSTSTPPQQGGEFENKIPPAHSRCKTGMFHFKKGGLLKRNGFCGGMADVVYDSFVFAYSAGNAESIARAKKARKMISGIGPWKLAGRFKVVSDTKLTPEFCADKHVILFSSKDNPGSFLSKYSEQLPFELGTNIIINGRQGEQLICQYPNPIAPNRYLLTVLDTDLDTKMLQQVRFDVLLDNKIRGSFDVNWDKVQWQDEFNSHKHNHNNTCSEYDGQSDTQLKKLQIEKGISSNSKRKSWKKLGMIICFIGLAVFYVYDYFSKKRKKA